MSDNVCPDGHVCRHGSLCTPHPYDEGAYYCDCDADFLNDQYAGLACEHTATTSCDFQQASVKFCTNNGTCRAATSSGTIGCECPDNYTGNQCQFIAGTKVPGNHPLYGESFNAEFSASAKGNGDNKLGGGIVALIVLIILGVVAAAIFVYYKRRAGRTKALDPTRPTAAAPEHVLDADGQVLKEAVMTGHGVNTVNGGGDEDIMMDLSLSSPTGSVEEGAPINGMTMMNTMKSSGEMEQAGSVHSRSSIGNGSVDESYPSTMDDDRTNGDMTNGDEASEDSTSPEIV